MNYSEFQAEDFIVNESFQNWYFQRDPKDFDFWEKWISQHPNRQAHIQEAKFILDSCYQSFKESDNGNLAHSWNKLQTNIAAEKPHQQFFIRSKHINFLLWAALISLVAITFVVWISQRSRQVVHRTAYGEIKSISLSDNSVVTLNSNSKLTFFKNFGKETQNREVWLEGEAYFSVVTTESQQNFLVYITDQLVVEVLGTEFNVKSREGDTKVVLNSGKITLKLKHEHESQNITMVPGELVAIPETRSDYQKTFVNTDLYTSWKCKLLVFDNTPLKDVTDILIENYGLQVEVSDATLLDLKVSGSVPSDNIKLLMEGLSESFGLTIQHTQNRVLIKERVN